MSKFEVVALELKKKLSQVIQGHKQKFLMVSFKAYNLLIQECYDA
jgi:hypothetical protein